MEPEPTVFVVDDDAAVLRAIAGAGKVLGRPVRSFASAAEFLTAYDPAQPGCLVLDIKMPGMTGLELQQELADKGLTIPIVVVSGHADVRIAVEVMTRGAVTLLEKPFRLDELLTHLRAALELDAADRARAVRQAETDSRLAVLTPKEREVLEAVATGKTNKEIAEELGLSLRAVEDRRARLMKKVQCRSVAELIQMLADRQGTGL
ncbi:MAG: tmoT [Gemmataceae bacterium]|nr:tmoT [Gemmataceae bacterium]